MPLPILKSPMINPDGSPASWLMDKERGKRALAKAKARKHLLEFTQYTSPDYNTNWHHKIICDYLERWAFGQGNDAIRRLMIFMPPGSGKLCADNTPVLTINGWKTHGELKIGDTIFTNKGLQTKVIGISTSDYADREVIFTNNTSIKVHHNHEWTIFDRRSSKWRTVETDKLMKPNLFCIEGKYNKKHYSFAVPNVSPIQFEEKCLDIDPYFLGAWLGDGNSDNPLICYAEKNSAVIDKCIIRCDTELGCHHIHPTTGVHYQYFKKIINKFRELDLINNKHIPEIYKYSSINQRLELLAGLIDTDGYVAKSGKVCFSNCNKTLIDDVFEIISSLGFRPFITKQLPKTTKQGITGRQIVYVIGFLPTMKIPTVLPQKQITRTITQRMLYIKSITPCEPEKGKCIQVDSPDGLYLVTKNLIPTHNSELVSRRLPAWIFGKNPDVGIMATSYAASLVEDMNIDVQRIMDSDAYKELFPNTLLSSRNSRNSLVGNAAARNRGNFEIIGHRGYYKCAGVGGSITGKRFFYGIIDDPLRGRQDAESITIRNTTYNWYVNDFYTRRLNQDARILITLTRWHADDLAGRLLSLAASNPKAEQWTVLKFPMVAEDPLEKDDPRQIGECLWPWRYGTLDDIEATKISVGTYTWSSLYQQRPNPPGGTIFNRGWWGDPAAIPPNKNQFYPANPLDLQNHMDIIILSADCTFKETDGTDYVVIQVWGRKGGDFYLLDQKRDRMDIITTMQNIRTLSTKWPRITAKLIEDKANGPAVITMLKRELPGLIPIEPQGGKVVRAQAITPYIESGNVWLPQPRNAPWLHDLLEELAAFPTARHDDQVDALTQAIFYLNNKNNFALPKVPRKAIRIGGGWEG